MKKCLLILFSLLLFALPALAEEAPVLSPEMACLAEANQTLSERYGLTAAALGLFDTTVERCGDTAIVTYTGSAIPVSLTGTYYVILGPESTQALWTHADAAEDWQSGELSCPVWGMPQLQKYLDTDALDRYDIFFEYCIAAEVDSGVIEFESDRAQRDAARALAVRAAAAVYSLPEEGLFTYADGCKLLRYPDGHTEWRVMVYLEGGTEEVSFYVTIHWETGLIRDIGVMSGGIG